MSSASWLDRAISYVSPVRGATRAHARAVMQALAYEGAKTGRRTDGWITGATSADAEIGLYGDRMRERARDLVRNNPHAAKGLAVIVSNKIGTGILCGPDPTSMVRPNQRLMKSITELWTRWIDSCDMAGRLDLYGIQSLAERTRAESGEALIRFVTVPLRKMGDVPLRLQVLEPDMLDSTQHRVLGDGSEILRGIEYSRGVPVAYWLFDAHPGDDGVAGRRSTLGSSRVPASEVLHYFKPLRAGQRRGITDFASVILRLRALDDYDDAEVMRKKVAACLAAFVTTPGGLPGSSLAAVTTDAKGQVETLYPGMVGYLKPGENVVMNDPKPSTDYKSFQSVQLHAIAAGLGVPYELLTGDLSEVTYTSHRGGLVQFRGMVEADQWQLVIPQICQPIWRRFLREAAVFDGAISPDTPAAYTPPRFGLLDPAKEIPALIQSIQSGIDSYQNVVRREGYDPMEKLAEIEAFQTHVRSRGLALSSIPTLPAAAAPESDQTTEDEANAA